MPAAALVMPEELERSDRLLAAERLLAPYPCSRRARQEPAARRQMAMLWVLNLSAGEHSLLDIAKRSGLPFATVSATAALLEAHDLLAEDLGPQDG